MLLLLLLSGVSMCLISGLLSIGFFFISHDVGAAVFWISMALQLLIMQPINRLLGMKAQKLELKRLEKLSEIGEIESKQITTLECSYCGEKNGLLVDVNAENSFTCNSCKNENKVVMQYSTVRTTVPLLTDLQTAREDVYGKMDEVAQGEDEDHG